MTSRHKSFNFENVYEIFEMFYIFFWIYKLFKKYFHSTILTSAAITTHRKYLVDWDVLIDELRKDIIIISSSSSSICISINFL